MTAEQRQNSKLGGDFWLILKIIIAVAKALIALLGDDNDEREAKNNGF